MEAPLAGKRKLYRKRVIERGKNMNHTYDEFERAAKGYGMYNQFSQSDLNLARSNPNAGMSILNYKRDYQNAPTAEARALANAGADKIRREYGNYSGGTDGSKYYLQQNRPMSYQSPAAPTYQNRYDDRIQNLLREIENRPAFSYNAETDDLYGQYKKQYTREGQRATADALGQAAAASGGMPSSYAVTAATQAGDYYASKMTDKIPELYQAAYDRYLNEYRQKAEALNMYQNAEQSDYNKYLTALNQHNADRSFNYGQYLDDISHQKEREQWERQKALQAAAMGDYRAANEQGINTDNYPAEFDKRFQLAKLAASMGDYSKLKEMGIDTSRADEFLMPKSGVGYRSSASRGVGRQQGMGQEYRSASADVDSIFERAKANHGAVYSLEEWQALLSEWDEEELNAKGYYFAGQGQATGMAPMKKDLKNLPPETLMNDLHRRTQMGKLLDKRADYIAEEIRRAEKEERARNKSLKNKEVPNVANDFYGMYSLSGYDPTTGLNGLRKRR